MRASPTTPFHVGQRVRMTYRDRARSITGTITEVKEDRIYAASDESGDSNFGFHRRAIDRVVTIETL
jgi:hypothetical protein